MSYSHIWMHHIGAVVNVYPIALGPSPQIATKQRKSMSIHEDQGEELGSPL